MLYMPARVPALDMQRDVDDMQNMQHMSREAHMALRWAP